MVKQKFYVVWVGRETGIFTDWPSTQKLVAGYPKARHKSFASRAEAEAAFKKGPATSVAGKAGQKVKKAPSKSSFKFDGRFDIHIFCDGGCDPNPGKSGSGVAVYAKGKLIERHYGLYNAHGTNNTAELNALHQSMIIARTKLDEGKKVQILADSTYAIISMTTWAADWQRRGWQRKSGELANAEMIALMYEAYLQIKLKINIQHVKAHMGTEGNELADRLSILSIKEKLEEFKLYTGAASISEMLAMDHG